MEPLPLELGPTYVIIHAGGGVVLIVKLPFRSNDKY
jgi:hypothetical protein